MSGHDKLGEWNGAFLGFLSRKKGDAGRRIRYWGRMLAIKMGTAEAEPPRAALPLTDVSADFSPGKRVRVKNLEEILPTMDKLGRLSGCKFLEPMARHCGQETQVVKRVDRFFDEARRRMLKCENVVLLDNTICDGSGHPDTMG